MTIMHHPTDPTLAAFASAALDEGQSLVVAVHLSDCPICRNAICTFEHIAGALLEDIEPAGMTPDALTHALARLDAPMPRPAPEARPHARLVGALPTQLSRYGLGAWRWIGPGVHWRTVSVPAGSASRVFMLKARPGTRLPHHRHVGTEWTCVLQGAFAHAHGRYGAGDFDEADESVEHVPIVENGVECVCLVAMQGQIKLRGLIGHVLQPFVRF